MLKIFQRYLASSFIHAFILSTLFFVIFLLLIEFFRWVQVIAKSTIDLETVIGLVSFMVLSFLPYVIPISALLATVYTMNKLSEHSEIVAIRSFGVSKIKLLIPFLIMGSLIALLIFALNSEVIPRSKKIARNSYNRLASQTWINKVEAGQFFTGIPNITLYSEKVRENNPEEKSILENVFIRMFKKGEENIITAKEGYLVKETHEHSLSPSLKVILNKGHIIKKMGKIKVEKISFDRYSFPIHFKRNLPGFITKDSMRTNHELRSLIHRRKKELNQYAYKEKQGQVLSNKEKIRQANLLNWILKSKLEFWFRWNTPFSILSFILLGFSLGIKKARGQTRGFESTSLIFVLGYYVLFFSGVALAKAGHGIPFLFVFIPTFIITLVGIHYFKKVDWVN